MAFEAILHEVDQLHNVSTRLEGLAEQHPPVSERLFWGGSQVLPAEVKEAFNKHECQKHPPKDRFEQLLTIRVRSEPDRLQMGENRLRGGQRRGRQLQEPEPWSMLSCLLR